MDGWQRATGVKSLLAWSGVSQGEACLVLLCFLSLPFNRRRKVRLEQVYCRTSQYIHQSLLFLAGFVWCKEEQGWEITLAFHTCQSGEMISLEKARSSHSPGGCFSLRRVLLGSVLDHSSSMLHSNMRLNCLMNYLWFIRQREWIGDLDGKENYNLTLLTQSLDLLRLGNHTWLWQTTIPYFAADNTLPPRSIHHDWLCEFDLALDLGKELL